MKEFAKYLVDKPNCLFLIENKKGFFSILLFIKNKEIFHWYYHKGKMFSFEINIAGKNLIYLDFKRFVKKTKVQK